MTFFYSTFFSTIWFLVLMLITISFSQLRLVLSYNMNLVENIVEKIEATDRPFIVLGYFILSLSIILMFISRFIF